MISVYDQRHYFVNLLQLYIYIYAIRNPDFNISHSYTVMFSVNIIHLHHYSGSTQTIYGYFLLYYIIYYNFVSYKFYINEREREGG